MSVFATGVDALSTIIMKTMITKMMRFTHLQARAFGGGGDGESVFATGVDAVSLNQLVCWGVRPKVVCRLHLGVVQSAWTH
jgi:hypothetical protein